MARALIAVCLIWIAGCSRHYQYKRLAHQDYLIPPSQKKAAPDKPARLRIRNTAAKCDVVTPTLTMRRSGRDVVVDLAPVAQDEPTRIPLDALKDFARFRDGLDDCLDERGASTLIEQLVYGLPMSTRMLHQLAFGSFGTTSVVDLRPPLYLRSVRPTDEGVKVARYKTEAGGSLRRVEGEATTFDEFIGRFQYFRLLFLTSATNQEHRSIVVGAENRRALKAATSRCMEGALDRNCHQLTGGAILAAQLPIAVDGVVKFVPIDASLREVSTGPLVTLRRGRESLPVRWETGADPRQIAVLGGEVITTKP